MISELNFSDGQRLAFCADIHIEHDDSPLSTQFKQITSTLCQDADALIILGDLFHLWVSPLCARRFNQTLMHLKALGQHCRIYFMPGNRDFLIPGEVLQAYHIHKLSDPCVLNHVEVRYLLSHGDQFCIHDTGYQRLRKIIQNDFFYRFFNLLPYSWRDTLAHHLRQHSQTSTPRKTTWQMDACPSTVRSWLQRYDCHTCIYGHVHALRDDHADANLSRIVLDSWQHQLNYLVIDDEGPKLQTC